MLIGGIALGLVLGLLVGGKPSTSRTSASDSCRCCSCSDRPVRDGGRAGLRCRGGGPAAGPAARPAYGLLLVTLWHNRGYPGLALAFVGIASNALVIFVTGGYMPVWMPAFEASGLPGPLASVLHVPLDAGTGPEFFLPRAPERVIPIPIWPLNNVASVATCSCRPARLLPVRHAGPAARRDAALDRGGGLRRLQRAGGHPAPARAPVEGAGGAGATAAEPGSGFARARA